ncbi:MAG: transglycosylase SLT domain-containing protein [Acetobacteraceae bacterium]
MTGKIDQPRQPVSRAHAAWVRLGTLSCLALVLFVTACSDRASGPRYGRYTPKTYYPPPGPPEDPWGPYIKQASARFGMPDPWIRAVLQRESGGRPDATSNAGAMGLMQVMPGTYAELQDRHGLDDDPYEPRNNILAGTAYLREMYDRFGAPGFLAAYNAGPRRLDDYLTKRRALPTETVNYVAAIAPQLGSSAPLSGPLAVYADRRTSYASRSRARPTPGVCDPDAAYDPTRPCASAGRTVMASATPAIAPASFPVTNVSRVCDPDEAYDPTVACLPAPPASRPWQEASAETGRSMPSLISSARAAPPPITRAATSASFDRSWAIQVGAFSTQATARLAADRARGAAPGQLQRASLDMRRVTTARGSALYRARLTGLSADDASGACAALARWRLDCVAVRMDGERSW